MLFTSQIRQALAILPQDNWLCQLKSPFKCSAIKKPVSWWLLSSYFIVLVLQNHAGLEYAIFVFSTASIISLAFKLFYTGHTTSHTLCYHVMENYLIMQFHAHVDTTFKKIIFFCLSILILYASLAMLLIHWFHVLTILAYAVIAHTQKRSSFDLIEKTLPFNSA